MDYRKKFVVEPGAKVRLSKVDPSYTGEHESQEKAASETAKHIERIDKLQYLLYADGNRSLLVILQALDMLASQVIGFGCASLEFALNIQSYCQSHRRHHLDHEVCDRRVDDFARNRLADFSAAAN